MCKCSGSHPGKSSHPRGPPTLLLAQKVVSCRCARCETDAPRCSSPGEPRATRGRVDVHNMLLPVAWLWQRFELWVFVGVFFLDKRGCMNISPDCYPGLHASPLSGTDLSWWAVLCLMWPEVIKSGPVGWCLPPPSLLSLCLLAFTQNNSDWWLAEGCRCFPCHDTAIDPAASANSSSLTLILCLRVWVLLVCFGFGFVSCFFFCLFFPLS